MLQPTHAKSEPQRRQECTFKARVFFRVELSEDTSVGTHSIGTFDTREDIDVTKMQDVFELVLINRRPLCPLVSNSQKYPKKTWRLRILTLFNHISSPACHLLLHCSPSSSLSRLPSLDSPYDPTTFDPLCLDRATPLPLSLLPPFFLHLLQMLTSD